MGVTEMRHKMPANSTQKFVASNAPTAGLEILLADASVEHLNVLLNGLRPGVKVFLVNPQTNNSLDYLADALSQSNLDTLHILGHGAPGEVILGSQKINLEALKQLETTMHSIKHFAKSNNDQNQSDETMHVHSKLETQICLWSCQTGAGQEGKEFMNALANLTNATIFATEHLVGNSSKGGTWNLEQTATPRRGAPFNTQALEEFDGILPITGDIYYFNQALFGFSEELGTIDNPFTYSDSWLIDGDWTTDALSIASGSLLTTSALIANGANFIGDGKVRIGVTGTTNSFSTDGFDFSSTGGYSFSISARRSLTLTRAQVQQAENQASASIPTVFSTTTSNPGTLIITGADELVDIFPSLRASANLIVEYAPVILSAEVKAGDVVYTDTSASDTFSSISGTINAVDIDGDTRTFSIKDAVENASLVGFTHAKAETFGTLYINSASGAYIFVPNTSAINARISGSASADLLFIVRVGDGTATTEQNLTIRIAAGANDAPVFTSDAVTINNLNDTTAVDDIANASGIITSTDADTGATRTFSIAGGSGAESTTKVGTYGTLIIDASTGAYTFTANDNAVNARAAGTSSTTEVFTIQVSDGTATVTQALTLAIGAGANDAPVFTSDAVTINNLNDTTAVDDIANASGIITSTDADTGATRTFSIAGGSGAESTTKVGTYGTLIIDASTGAYTFTANDNAVNARAAGTSSTTEVFTIQVSDGSATTTQALTLDIGAGINDIPVAVAATQSVDENLTISGSVSAIDADAGETAGLTYSLTGTIPEGLAFNSDGTYTFDASSYDSLVEDEPFVLNIPYTATDIRAATSNVANLVITITGTNDLASISGSASDFIIESDEVQSVGGSLSVADLDDGEDQFQVVINAAGDNGYGTFNLDSTGSWTYTMDSAQNAFNEGIDYTDSITVSSADGTADQVITVTITGTNDLASISGSASDFIIESDEVQSVGGSLSVADLDDGEDQFQVVINAAGDNGYGTFNLDSTGSWTYTMDSAQNAFNEGIDYTDSITVSSADGTADQVITVTITGTNDLASISGSASDFIIESDEVQSVGGSLSVADLDDGEDQFQVVINAAGDNGYGTFNLDSTGSWTYTMDSAQNAFNEGIDYTDSITVSSADGTADQVITVTITGTNDLASISGSASDFIIESDEVQSVGGSLSVADLDDGEDQFQVVINAAGDNGYGTFNLDSTGSWTYTMDSAQDQFVDGETYTDSITVSSADGTADQVITVTITGTNDAPGVSAEVADEATEDGDIVTVRALANAIDAEDDILSVINIQPELPDGVSYDEVTQSFSLDPKHETYQSLAADETIEVRVAYDVYDGIATTATSVVFTITGTNDLASISGSASDFIIESDEVQSVGGSLSVADLDDGEDQFQVVINAAGDNGYGTFNLDSTGSWTYTMDSAQNAFNEGIDYTDSITVSSADGTADQVITVTITGTNDLASISGSASDFIIESDEVQSVGGSLSVADLDDGEDQFQVVINAAGDNGYGTFNLDSTGSWTYTMDSAQNAFNEGIDYTDSITVSSADGTADQVITVTITGTNDLASISGSASDFIIESDEVQSVGGSLSVADLDDGEDQFQVVINAAGDNGYGTFNLDSTGSWTYTMDSAQNAFNEGIDYTDSITVSSADGTADQVITVTITGTNDLASISGSASDFIIESDEVQSVGGSLSVADLDDGEDQFQVVINAAGDNGYGTFNLDSTGSWTYTMDSAQNAFNEGIDYTDSITVSSADGTADQVITVTITGTNDAPGVSAEVADEATEDGDIVTVRALANAIDAEDDILSVINIQPELPDGVSYDEVTQSFSLDPKHETYQSLAADETIEVRVAYDVYDGIATTATSVVFTITGTNDLASISGSASDFIIESDEVQSVGGSLSVADLDDGEDQFQVVINAAGDNGYGTFNLDSTGSWTYTMDSAQNAFNEGIDYTDSITVSSADGTADQVITVTITGTNDLASISGSASDFIIESDEVQSVGGSLSVADLDDGEDQFQVVINAAGDNGYGTFNLDSTGSWTYTMDSAQNAFNEGIDYTDSITVSSADGTADQVITVTITGTNDLASISGSASDFIIESDEVQSVGGSLSVADLDDGEDQFQVVINAAGDNGYGTFNLDSTGSWTYTMDSAQNAFNEGIDYTDSITVSSADGTADQVITVTITGTNDLASISGSASDFIIESDEVQSVGGSLSVADLDDGEDQFQVVINAAGDNGYGTFNLDSTGSWTYTMDSAQNAFNEGIDYTDSITVSSADGTADQVITVTITGTNDLASISGSASDFIIESDEVQSVGGSLSVADLDDGEDQFQVVINAAGDNGYGTFNLDSTGSWTYTMDSAQNAFNEGIDYTDSITVSSADGTADQVITVTITGTNDLASISGSASDFIIESDEVQSVGGSLSVADLDDGEDQFQVVINAAGDNGYGTFNLDSTGSWTYTMDSAQNAFNEGIDYTDSITVSSADGTADQVITVTITGTNDLASISGSASDFIIESDEVQSVGGSLSVADLDDGEDQFQVVINAAGDNGYGTFNLDSTGSWTYTMDSAQNAFNEGIDYTDSITVSSADGTADQVITVTITGTNDLASISGSASDFIIESDEVQSVGGSLSVADLDDGEDQFQVVINAAGDNGYGTFNLDSTGSWTYTMDSAQNAFNEGIDYTDSITVSSADGTADQVITVTITGTNDLASISGSASDFIIESDEVQSVGGSLSVADLDDGEDQFQVVINAAGDNGYGTFNLDSTGSWTYTMDSAQNAFNEGIDYTDSITVSSADGTADQVITVTITGTNDLASISGSASDFIIESDEVQSVGGSLSVADLDDGEDQFQVVINAAGDNGYGTFNLDSTGSWTYTMDSAQDQFVDGETYTDSITVSSADGTADQVITVTITGTNDLPDVSSGFVTPAKAIVGQVLTADPSKVNDVDNVETEHVSYQWFARTIDSDGVLGDPQQIGTGVTHTVTVADAGKQIYFEMSFGPEEASSFDSVAGTAAGDLNLAGQAIARNNINGQYGVFSVSSDGVWTYTLDDANSSVAELQAGSHITDTFIVELDNGQTDRSVTIDIVGNYDNALVLANDSTDNGIGKVVGTFGAGEFATQNIAGDYGYLSIDSTGAWTYSLDTSTNLDVIGLGDGGALTENIILSLEGAPDRAFVINISGSDANGGRIVTANVGYGAVNGAEQSAFEVVTSNPVIAGFGEVVVRDSSHVITVTGSSYQLSITDLGVLDGEQLAPYTGSFIISSLEAGVSLIVDGEDRSSTGDFTALELAAGKVFINGASGTTNIGLETIYVTSANTIIAATPGSSVTIYDWAMSDWTIAPSYFGEISKFGYTLTNVDDPNVIIRLADSVRSITFADESGALSLDTWDNSTTAVITINDGSGISITDGETQNVRVVVATSDNVSIDGGTDSDSPYGNNYREDIVTLDQSYAGSSIASNNGDLTVTKDGQVVTLRDVEAIQFDDGVTVRVVGAGGYSRLAEASNGNNDSHAQSGDVVFISNDAGALQNDTVNSNGLIIQIEAGHSALNLEGPGTSIGAMNISLASGVNNVSIIGDEVAIITANNDLYGNTISLGADLNGSVLSGEVYSASGVTVIGGTDYDSFEVMYGSSATLDNVGPGGDRILTDFYSTVTANLSANFIADVSTTNWGDVTINANSFDVDLTNDIGGTNGYTINAAGDTVASNNITGSQAADSINSSGADTINAQNGNDQITIAGAARVNGQDGDDTINLVTGASNATLTGGAGDDTYTIGDSITGVTITDLGLGGDATLTVADGASVSATLRGNFAADTQTANYGSVTIDAKGYDVDLRNSADSPEARGYTINNYGADNKLGLFALNDVVEYNPSSAHSSPTTLEFDFYNMDSWDGEIFSISLNNDEFVLLLPFQHDSGAGLVGPMSGEDTDTGIAWTVAWDGITTQLPLPGSSPSWPDRKFHITLDFTEASPSLAISKVSFSSNLGSMKSDESWAIDNFAIDGVVQDFANADSAWSVNSSPITSYLVSIDGEGGNSNITGSQQADSINSSGADTINAQDGNDQITIAGAAVVDGQIGNDTINLIAGANDAALTGGLGEDTFTIGDSITGITITDLGRDGDTTLEVGAGSDVEATLGGSFIADSLTANFGDVTINVAGNDVDLQNSANTDGAYGYTINAAGDTVASNITGSQQADSINSSGADTINAQDGNDQITIAGAAVVDGQNGEDTINLVFGADNAALTGGEDNDTFNVAAGITGVTIADLGLGGDNTLSVGTGSSVTATLGDDFTADTDTANFGDVTINVAGNNVNLSADTGDSGYTINNTNVSNSFEFDFYRLDSWDRSQNDSFIVYIDDQEIVSTVYQYNDDLPVGILASGTNNGYAWTISVVDTNEDRFTDSRAVPWPDQKLHYTISAVNDTGLPIVVKLQSSNLDINPDNESWGIDNFKIGSGTPQTFDSTVDGWVNGVTTVSDSFITVNPYGNFLGRYVGDEFVSKEIDFSSNAIIGGADNISLIGSGNADTITSGGSDVSIYGMGGDDQITIAGTAVVDGEDGNDTINLIAGANDAALTGGLGEDTFTIGDSITGITITDLGRDGDTTLEVGAGSDVEATLGGSFIADSLTANFGDVTINVAGNDVDLQNSANTDGAYGYTINAAGDTVASNITGSQQADSINSSGADTINAQDGNDQITIAGAAVVDGQNGEDTINLVFGAGGAALTGGEDNDTFNVAAGITGVTITDLGLGGDNTLSVGTGSDVVATLGGSFTADTATANLGDVTINVAGNDVDLQNSANTDGAYGYTINAVDTADTSITGSQEADSINSDGLDTINAQDGDDQITIAGTAVVDGQNGEDTINLVFGADNAALTGGEDNDTFNVAAGITGVTIADLGLGGDNTLQVGAGSDVEATLGGSFIADAQSSNDGGVFIVTGNNNLNLSSVEASRGFYIDAAGDLMILQEFGTLITASSANDTILANGGDTVLAGSGNDTVDVYGGILANNINGEDGNDLINLMSSGADNAVLTGGLGEDTFTIGDSITGVTITDLGRDGDTTLEVGAGSDVEATLGGSFIADSLTANFGDVTINVAGNDVDLQNSANTDGAYGYTINAAGDTVASNITGSQQADSINSDGFDTINAQDGNDQITIAGTAVVDGQNGEDTINLVAGAGGAALTGGEDNDTFNVAAGITGVTITDLGLGGDNTLSVGTGSAVEATLGGSFTADSDTANLGSVTISATSYDLDLSLDTMGTSGYTINAVDTADTSITGSQQADSINSDGLDTINAQDGDDQITIAGAAVVDGQNGEDTINLVFGADNAALTGGEDNDTFIVGDNITGVTITDLGLGGDNTLSVGTLSSVQATLGGSFTADSDTANLGSVTISATSYDLDLSLDTMGTSGYTINAVDTADTSITGSQEADSINSDGLDTINAQDGNDQITIAGTAVVDGQNGEDTINLIAGANDAALTGGLGEDTFTIGDSITGITITDLGRDGDTTLEVGAGSDVEATLGGSFIADSLTANFGDVTINVAGNDVDLQNSANTDGAYGYTINAAGDTVASNITGSQQADSINSDGFDTINAQDGNDQITIAGAAVVDGEDGNDTINLIAGANDAALTGGLGEDTFTIGDSITGITITDLGRDGDTTLEVGAGSDVEATLGGSFIADSLTANFGDVTINVAGNDVDLQNSANTDGAYGYTINAAGDTVASNITGSQQADSINSSGADTINAQDGNDQITIAGAAVVDGEDGNDTINLVFGADNAALTGGEDNDTFIVGDNITGVTITDLGLGGDNTLSVGTLSSVQATLGGSFTADSDTANLGSVTISATSYDLDLSLDTMGTSGYTINAVDTADTSITGSQQADSINSSGADTINAQDGNDQITIAGAAVVDGEDGNDTINLIAGANDAALTGGLGEDTFTIGDSITGITITDLGRDGDTTLEVGAGSDVEATLGGSFIADSLTANFGDVTINVAGNDVDLQNSANTDGAYGYNINAVDGANTSITGSQAADSINSSGADTINAQDGNDQITIAGAAVVDGEDGNDTINLIAGANDAALTGGLGEDTFTIGDSITGITITDLGRDGDTTLEVGAGSDVEATLGGSFIADSLTANFGDVTINVAGNDVDLQNSANTDGAYGYTINAAGDTVASNITGSQQADSINSSGADTINAQDGNDQITIAGAAVVDGQNGEDTINLVFGAGGAALTGGLGEDTFTIGDSITGITITDLGRDGDTTLEVGAGSDVEATLGGSFIADSLTANFGDVTINVAGNDVDLQNSANTDGAYGYTINAAGDTVASNITGSQQADSINSSGADTINAQDGNDQITIAGTAVVDGEDGNDTINLIAGANDAALTGGLGEDTFTIGDSITGITITDLGRDGDTTLEVGAGSDVEATLGGSFIADSLTANFGDVTINVAGNDVDLQNSANTDGAYGYTINAAGDTVASNITGSQQADSINSSGADTINAQDGNDQITIAGAAVVDGEDGNDTINLIAGANDAALTGGLGEDTFTIGDSITGITITDLGRDGDTTLEVGAGSDVEATLGGSFIADSLTANFGDVTINVAGNDVDLQNSANTDGAYGYNINAVDGANTSITGSQAADSINSSGADTINAQDGNDQITIAGAAVVDGEDGNDTINLIAGANDAALTGGLGEDTFTIGDSITGITITDLGRDGDTTLEVGAGSDVEATLGGSFIADSLTANFGDVTINVAGNDVDLQNSANTDGAYGYTINAAGDTVASNITGSQQADSINSSGADTINAQDGNDQITIAGAAVVDGQNGEDTINLVFGAGGAALTGGLGEDTFTIGDSITGITITDLGRDGDTTLEVGAGSDVEATLGGSFIADSLTANFGDVTINVAGNDVDLQNSANTDGAYGYTINAAGDTVASNITGSQQADSINSSGADTINAGGGNDIINAGTGNQRITGGNGVDTFNITAGLDTITDLSGIGVNADALVVSEGASVIATLGDDFTANSQTSNTGTATINVVGNNLDLSAAAQFGDKVQTIDGVDAILGPVGSVDNLDGNVPGPKDSLSYSGFSGTTSKIEFDFYKLTSWDDENFIILINEGDVDQVVISNQYSLWDAPENRSGLVNGIAWSATSAEPVTSLYDGYGNEFKQHFTLTFSGSPEGFVVNNIALTSTLDQIVADESWAIDNFRVNDGPIQDFSNGYAGWTIEGPNAASLVSTNNGYNINAVDGANTSITGSQAADSINSSGADTINAQDGNDQITIAGAAVVDGEDGNDTINLIAGANDAALTGGLGEDTFTIGDSITGVTITDLGRDGDTTLEVGAGSDVEATLGGSFIADSLTANFGDVTINVAGNDVDLQNSANTDGAYGYTINAAGDTVASNITGSQQADSINSSGADTINAQDGDDQITIAGAAVVDGQNGEDTINLIAGADNAALTGGEDNDTFNVAAGITGVTIADLGLGGDTTLTVGTGSSVIATLMGNFIADSLTANYGDVTIYANVRNIDLFNANGDRGYTINAADSDESDITGSRFADTIIASDLVDSIYGGAGHDYIDGHDGIDQVVFNLTGLTLGDKNQELAKFLACNLESDGIEITFGDDGDVTNLFDNTTTDPEAPRGINTLKNIEELIMGGQRVIVVGAGSEHTFEEALALAANTDYENDIIYVADTSRTNFSVTSSGMNIIFADNLSAAAVINSNGGEVNLFGDRQFTFNGSSSTINVDIVHDYTNVASKTNIINANGGNDSVVVHGSGSTIVYGGAGNDKLVGGASDQLFGNDGIDTLLAFDGAAYLSGGAGNDILINAYIKASETTMSSTTATDMFGGSGTDTFVLMSTAVSVSGENTYMKTNIIDLGTGDKIDLSFLENANLDTFVSKLSVTTAPTMTLSSAGTTLDLDGYDVSSVRTATESDIDSNAASNVLLVANTNGTKTAAAISTSGSTVDSFNSLFGDLNLTYPIV
jgi:VCBS repeat-containing protein